MKEEKSIVTYGPCDEEAEKVFMRILSAVFLGLFTLIVILA
jgi:hypothetical protein